ncbi:MAG: hypothetical protein IPP73_11595 [Chitinophagaceae bacterium]|nr:hypothetical protein [Chitinophagaceae bacterium]
MATSQGNHIGYNEVQVSRVGNGKSVYRYYGSNLWDEDHSDVAIRNINTTSCSTDIPNYPAAPLPFEYLRGELKYEAQFKESGSIIKESSYYQYMRIILAKPAFIADAG